MLSLHRPQLGGPTGTLSPWVCCSGRTPHGKGRIFILPLGEQCDNIDCYLTRALGSQEVVKRRSEQERWGHGGLTVALRQLPLLNPAGEGFPKKLISSEKLSQIQS